MCCAVLTEFEGPWSIGDFKVSIELKDASLITFEDRKQRKGKVELFTTNSESWAIWSL